MTLNLTGNGAAYLRVSTDKQDTARQINSAKAFAERHAGRIAPRHWFEDHGWERDADRERPEFNRLLGLARRGEVNWIVVDSLDRFGTKSAKRLMGYLADLEEVGCKLYTADGKEWTGEDDATELTAWLGGRTSMREQREKAHRTLSGMVTKAKAGEWMGATPKLGFDVACFDRADPDGPELWRVTWEGRDDTGRTETRRGKVKPVYCIRRLKTYPDGKTERMDGTVVFKTSDTQLLRIVPSRDPAKIAAVKGLFSRYATEAVSYFSLAKWLNGLGLRNSFGGHFQANEVIQILTDEAYLGYATYNKRRAGRFKRYDGETGLTELEPELRGKETANDPADVVKSRRIFDPIIDRPTWDAVRQKISGRQKRQYTPRDGSLYLAGLVVCAGCGAPMLGRKDRHEYYCGTWTKHRSNDDVANSPCERNGVRQATLEGYVSRYLEEAGQRLALLTGGTPPNGLTGRLEEQASDAWRGFTEGITRLTAYLAQHHPDEYNALLREDAERAAEMADTAATAGPRQPGTPTLVERLGDKGRAALADFNRRGADATPAVHTDDFVEALVACYKATHDPAAVAAEVAQLEAQHTALMRQWADLPTPRAKEKARAELAALEGRITALEAQQQDASEVVAVQYRQLRELEVAIADARQAMRTESGESALRQRAQRLRGLLCRIECEFVLTGKGQDARGGRGLARSRLAAVTFYPVAGDMVKMGAADGPADNVVYRSQAGA